LWMSFESMNRGKDTTPSGITGYPMALNGTWGGVLTIFWPLPL
jgi:hypothetical protein